MTYKRYEIHVKNHLDNHWAEWFEVENIYRIEPEITILIVRIPDQPGLHGLLEKIRDLNLTLLSVNELPGSD